MCQTPLHERTDKHVVQHVVGLLASRPLVVRSATDETRTSCRCCITFCLHESWLAKNGGRSRRANSLWHFLVFVRVVEFDTMLSIINMFRRLSCDKPRNALKFLVKRRHVFNTLISHFKRGDHITDSDSGYYTPTIRTCCNTWRATNAAYLLTYFSGQTYEMKASTTDQHYATQNIDELSQHAGEP